MAERTMAEDHARLATTLEKVATLASEFHSGLAQRPVAARYDADPWQDRLDESGQGAEAAIDAFAGRIMPHLSGSVGPRYLGFVTGGVTPAALAGDWLAAAVDQNLAMPGDSIATQVSLQALGWVLDLFGLPRREFDGCFTTGATASNFLSLVVARQWAGEADGVSPADTGCEGASTLKVFSATPHASFIKVMGLTGLGRDRVRAIATLPGREAMDPADLDWLLATAGPGPKMVVASAGTVSTTDFDDLARVAEICRTHGAWLHVDGAFGIFTRCVPSLAHLAAGLELADSITGDAHKWFNVPYDSGFFLTRRIDLLERACGVEAAYLQSGGSEPRFIGRGLECSQRFRALPLWLTLKAYGRKGAAAVVESCCAHAGALGEWIGGTPEFELLAPVNLNVVIFCAVAPEGRDAAAFNKALLARLNAGGKAFMTPGEFAGRKGIRAAFTNWMTDKGDVSLVTEALREAWRETKDQAEGDASS
jgi:glutamate/tyrosine decarboxylase-like PLP-dependent enzyme